MIAPWKTKIIEKMRDAEYGIVIKCESERSSQVFQQLMIRHQLLIIFAASLQESIPARHNFGLDAAIQAS